MIRLEPEPGPGSSVQWIFNGEPLPGATAATLQLRNLTTQQSGNYWAKIQKAEGTEESSITTINVLVPPASPVDRTFAAELPAGSSIAWVLARADDGSLLVGYSQADRASVAKLGADGRRVSDFAFPATAGRALDRLRDGRILVSKPPYLLEPDGRAGAGLVLPTEFPIGAELTAGSVQRDGTIIVAASRWVARFGGDGSVDRAFQYRPPTLDLDTSAPLTFTTDRWGRIYVHSNAEIFRLDHSGAHDPTFAIVTPSSAIESPSVHVLEDGRLLRTVARGPMREHALLRDDGTVDPLCVAVGTPPMGPTIVDPVHNRLFACDLSGGTVTRFLIQEHSIVRDPTFYSGGSGANDLFLDAAGNLLVPTADGQWGNFLTPLARLSPDQSPVAAPFGSILGNTAPVKHGSVELSVTLFGGLGPYSYQWIALDGQPMPAVSSESSLVLSDVTRASLGRYQCRVTGPGGSTLTDVYTMSAPSAPSFLVNLSGRALTGDNEDTMVVGVVAQPYAALLARGAGPALLPLAVEHAIADPSLKVFDGVGTRVASNDDWGAQPGSSLMDSIFQAIGAFPFAENSKDAAILLDRDATTRRTVHLSPAAGSTHGVALAEIYSFDGYAESQLLNLSMRCRAGTGDATAVAGFVIAAQDSSALLFEPCRILLRAIGPTLSTQGITHPLANPVLTLFDRAGKPIATNDDWAVNNTSGDSTALAATMQQVGAFTLPTDSKDAALLVDLPPGAYTMHASGGEGVVLLEVYLVW